MNTSLTHLPCLFALGICIGMPMQLHADPSTLESNSPFLPPNYSSQKAQAFKPEPTTPDALSRELEFRGIVQFNDIYQFSIFDKKNNQSYWIEENQSVNNISVSNFDLDTMRIMVTRNGRSEPLTLINVSDQPLPVANATPASVPNQVQTPKIPGLSSVTTQPTTSTRRTLPRRRRVILPKTQ